MLFGVLQGVRLGKTKLCSSKISYLYDKQSCISHTKIGVAVKSRYDLLYNNSGHTMQMERFYDTDAGVEGWYSQGPWEAGEMAWLEPCKV